MLLLQINQLSILKCIRDVNPLLTLQCVQLYECAFVWLVVEILAFYKQSHAEF